MPTDTVTYTYGDDEWGDLLTGYDGNTITYDGIGNPLTDGTWAYTWEHGRELAAMTDGSTSWTFTYGVDGLRTKRTNGAKTYDYVYIGSQLRQMKVGSDTLKFAYDAGGVPLTLQIGDTYYFYLTNLQGDVIGITDSIGTTVVSYTYDAWGNPLSTTGSLASTIGTLNPLRYRGYVYDAETGLYYISSRYYDPEIGRFINRDGLAYLGAGNINSYNLFAYCGNNPASYFDIAGCVPVYILDRTETNKSSGGKYEYSTTVYYSVYDSEDWFGPWNAVSLSVTVNYNITADGAIIVNNDDNPLLCLLPPVVSYALSSEMKNQAQNVKSDALSGRTTLGIASEIFWHSLGNIFLWGKLKESARESNMGGTNKNSMDYDGNAMFFENPLRYLIDQLFGGG